jgi:hypothetical protein
MTSPPGGARISLTDSSSDVGWLRDTVRALLAGHAPTTIADAMLVADSLVTATFRHGIPWEARLALTDGQACLRIEVDTAGSLPPLPAELATVRGLGRLLLEELATSWGVDQYQRHETAWAELNLMS